MPASALPSLLQDLLVSNVNLAPLPSLLQDHLLLAIFSTQGRRLPFFLLPALALIQGSLLLSEALAVKQGSLLLSKAPCCYPRLLACYPRLIAYLRPPESLELRLFRPQKTAF